MKTPHIFLGWLSLLLAVLAANTNFPEDARNVGCYVTPSNKVQASKAFLSWSQCVHLCRHKSLRFAGIQAEPSSNSTYNLCYCFDHLEELSTNVSSSLCQPCVENNEKFCGGDHTMSVYQLCDSQCLTLLLATSVGVKIGTCNSTTSVGGYTGGVRSLDFHYKNEGVFFLTDEGSFRSVYYNSFMMRYAAEKRLGNNTFKEMAVDWVNDICYFKNMETDSITTTSLLNDYRRNMFFGLPSKGEDIAIDPYRRLLFHIQSGNLFSYYIDNNYSKRYTSGSVYKGCQKVALDIGQRTIYMICEENDQYHLLSFDYDDKNLRLLFNGPQLSKPTAFDVFDREVVWANKNNDQHYVLCRCKLNPGCLPTNVETILEINEAVNDFKIYHPQELTFSSCAGLNCSHNCTEISIDQGQCSCPETFRLSADNQTCQEFQKLPTNVIYLGCYSTYLTYNSMYSAQHSLSWEECVALCYNRMTRYVGVQQEESAPSFNVNICGNRLIDQFQLVNSSLCQPCQEEPERYCGGNNTMSVYQLRGSTPLAVLLATDRGVSMFSSDTSLTTVTINHHSAVTHVDFHSLDDKIFFVSEGQVWSSQYSPFFMEYLKPTYHETPQWIGGLAVDWTNNTLCLEAADSKYSEYYGSNRRLFYDQNSKYALFESDFSAKHLKKTKDLPDAVQEMKIDSYNRQVCFILNGILSCFKIESESANRTYDNKNSHIKKVTKLALESSQKTVYLVGVDESDKYFLMKIGYEDSKMRRLYNGPFLTNPFGLDVSGDMVVWGNEDDGQYTLYTCQLSPRCRPENIRQILEQTKKINDFKIYYPQELKHPCAGLNCSYNCSKISLDEGRCTCPETLILGADNRTCHEPPKPQPYQPWPTSHVTYVGCYSTLHTQVSLYKAQQSLSWEECVALCDNRMTRYVGVQQEESAFTYNFPYCMNSLDEQFQVVNSSLCHSCVEDSERYCGGRNTMSVYQLRDSAPLAVLLATVRGVSMFSSDTNSTTSRINHTAPVSHVDFYYLEDKIFFSSSLFDGLWSSQFSPFSKKYFKKESTFHVGHQSGLAVDWVNSNIYLEAMSYNDLLVVEYPVSSNLEYSIFEIGLKAEHYNRITWLNETGIEMEVDPYNRRLFFIKNNVLHSYGIKKGETKKYDNAESHINKVMKLSLNIIQEVVYLIGVDESHICYLMKTGYEDPIMRRLYNGPQLTRPFGLGVSGDMVVWGNEDGGQYTLYTCQLSPRCQQHDIKQIYQQTEQILNLRIYQPDIQTLNLTQICSKLKCSHNCSYIPLSTVQCTCPERMVIGDDKKSCEHTITTTASLTVTTSTQLATEVVVVSTKESDIFEPLRASEATSSNMPSSTIVAEKERLDQSYTTVPSETITETTNTPEQPKSELNPTVSSTSSLETLFLSGVILLVVLLVVLIFLNTREKRLKRDFRLSSNAVSEMNVLTDTSNM